MFDGVWGTLDYAGTEVLVTFKAGLEVDSPWSAMYLMGTLTLGGIPTDVAATLTVGGRVIESLFINDASENAGAADAAWDEAADVVKWIASEHYAKCSLLQIA